MSQVSSSNNRSEEIRQRRVDRFRKPVSSKVPRRARKTGTHPSPPILIRGAQGRFPVKEQRGTNSPRRFSYIALKSSPGAEARLPSLSMARIGWRLVSGLLVCVLFFAIYTLWNSPMYLVTAAQIEGLNRLTEHEIYSVIGVSGKPVFALNPLQIRQNLLTAFPELSKVSVTVAIPATVRVSVVERTPVLAWKQDSQVIWVDAEGMSFPKRLGSDPPVLIQADSEPSIATTSDVLKEGTASRFIPPQLVTAILAISSRAPENTPLMYTHNRGLGWKDSRGWEVYFGTNVASIDMKLRVYDAMLKYLADNQIQPALISVESVHAPYYRMER